MLAADEFEALTLPTDLGSLQVTEEPQRESQKETFEDVRTEAFEDIRIEPFFGPRRSASNASGAEGVGGGQDPETSSPLRRFTGNAIESARNGARRILKNGAEAVKRRKPLIYVKNGGIGPEVLDDEDEENIAPSLPPITLLTPPPRASAKMNAHDPALMARASALMSVLGDFGVKGRISGIYPGPVITLFELEPARGTKSSRVVGLADDIARSMSAVSARVAVVPGRDAIGIELPNPKREIVALRAIIESNAFQDTQAALPLALGKSIGGEPIVVDLARMPHLLIAGTTGSGKSVGINTMILSLLYRLPPSQCNFIMIDPKMLELSVYDRIPHLLAPVVTDPKKAVAALKWTVKEMNTRYELMSKLGVRNITSYNQKVRHGSTARTKTAASGADRLRSSHGGADRGGGNLRSGVHDLYRGRHRRNGRPHDGRRQGHRICRSASFTDGAGGRNTLDHGDAAAQRGCGHRHDQGQLPKSDQLPGHVENR